MSLQCCLLTNHLLGGDFLTYHSPHAHTCNYPLPHALLLPKSSPSFPSMQRRAAMASGWWRWMCVWGGVVALRARLSGVCSDVFRSIGGGGMESQWWSFSGERCVVGKRQGHVSTHLTAHGIYMLHHKNSPSFKLSLSHLSLIYISSSYFCHFFSFSCWLLLCTPAPASTTLHPTSLTCSSAF